MDTLLHQDCALLAEGIDLIFYGQFAAGLGAYLRILGDFLELFQQSQN